MRQRCVRLVWFILLAECPVSHAAADTLWTRTYGGADDDQGCSVTETPDHGYFVSGYTASFGHGGFDFYVIKTDSIGDTLWTETYGGANADYGWAGQAVPGAGYVVAGYTWSFGQGGSDFYLVRVDPNGDTLWSRTYGGTGYDEAYSVAVTSDRGFVLAGQTNSSGAGGFDCYLVKTDSLGHLQWARTYGGSEDDEAYSVVPTQDGGYVLVGATRSFSQTDGAVYLVRTDALGDTIWTRTFAWAADSRGYGVLSAPGPAYLVAGRGYTVGLGDDMLYFKATSTGQCIWYYFTGGLRDDCAYAIREIPGRGFLVAGNFYQDLYIVETDTGGRPVRGDMYGGVGQEAARAMERTQDGYYILTGYTSSQGAGGFDVYLLKYALTNQIQEARAGDLKKKGIVIRPNPFNASTTIDLPWCSAGPVDARIFDCSGRLVKILNVDFRTTEPNRRLTWSGDDDGGLPLPRGVYLLRVRSRNATGLAKIVLRR